MKSESFTCQGETITIPRPQSFADCFYLVRSDRFRLTGKNISGAAIFLRTLVPFFPDVLLWFRLCQYRPSGWKKILRIYPRAVYAVLSYIRNIDIPAATRIGYGLNIGHGMGIVVNRGTAIGNNVNLSQFLNIGTNRRTPATIGNNVYLGPAVCVVEDVEIGSGAVVAAGAVVVKSIPAGRTAAGVPARVTKQSAPDFILNPAQISPKLH